MPHPLARPHHADQKTTLLSAFPKKDGYVIAGCGEQFARRVRTAGSNDGLPSSLGANPYRVDPASHLASFEITTVQRTQLAGLNHFCRGHEIGLLLYAHLYRETCRHCRVAILSNDADLALQGYWQANRDTLIEDVLDVFFGELEGPDENLDDLAARVPDAANEVRLGSEDARSAASDSTYDACRAFRRQFSAVTGLEPQRLGQLQMEGVL